MQAILQFKEVSSGRPVYSFAGESADDLAHAVPTAPGEHFVLFLAWDPRGVRDDDIIEVARKLIHRGLAYIVAWGPDCQRVHDLFDSADIELNPKSNSEGSDTVIMSTWHEDEPLEEALWFAIHSAYPASPYDDTWCATIAAAVGSPQWAASINAYLADPASLDRAVGVSSADA